MKEKTTEALAKTSSPIAKVLIFIGAVVATGIGGVLSSVAVQTILDKLGRS